MFIVVEGIDRVGKTTLCNMLKKEGFNIIKDDLVPNLKNKLTSNEKQNCALNSMNTAINIYKSVGSLNIVLDRFHATEYVYSVADRNTNEKIAKEYFDIIENQLETLNDYVYVYVTPTDLNLSERMHNSSLSRHNLLFDNLYHDMRTKNIIKVNYNCLNKAVEFIKRKMK